MANSVYTEPLKTYVTPETKKVVRELASQLNLTEAGVLRLLVVKALNHDRLPAKDLDDSCVTNL